MNDGNIALYDGEVKTLELRLDAKNWEFCILELSGEASRLGRVQKILLLIILVEMPFTKSRTCLRM